MENKHITAEQRIYQSIDTIMLKKCYTHEGS